MTPREDQSGTWRAGPLRFADASWVAPSLEFRTPEEFARYCDEGMGMQYRDGSGDALDDEDLPVN